MSNSRNAFTSLLHRLGVLGLVGVRAFGGTGAPKSSQGTSAPVRLILAILTTTLATLAFTAAPALAAAPETPVLSLALPVHSTEATLNGVLNPAGVTPEAGTYEFLYKKASALCTGEGKAPVPSGLMLGVEPEPVSETLKGLLPGTEYAVCLQAENTAKTKTLSAPVTFTTVPTPTTEAVTPFTASTATFHGKLKPLNEKVATEYSFEYNLGEGVACSGESHTEPAGNAGTGKGTEVTVQTAVTKLQPNQKYTVCLVSLNEFGPGEFGSEVASPVYFATPVAKPEVLPTSETAPTVTPYEATLRAEVNANNQETTVYFQYSTSPTVIGESLATPTDVPAAPGNNIGAGFGNSGVTVETGHVLAPNTTYYFQAVAINPTGTAYGKVEHFTTLTLVAPIIESETSSEITSEHAKLEAQVNPNYQETSCKFEYATEEAKVAAGEGTTVPCQAALGDGGSGVGTSIELSALKINTEYHWRVLAENETSQKAGKPAAGPIKAFTTETAVAPTVSEESTSSVASTSATFTALVNPGGAVSAYTFEYAPAGGAFAPVTEPEGRGNLAASDLPIPLSVHVQHALTPGASYEFRLVVSNAVKSVTAEAVPFTMQSLPAAPELPDSRAWELVSPPDKHGGSIQPITHEGGAIQAAENGDAITYVTVDPIVVDPPGNRALEPSQVLSKRGTGGWSTEDITTPNDDVGNVRVGYDATYEDFSPDLSLGLAEPTGRTPLAPPVLPGETQEKTLWLRDDSTGSYLALATAANTQPGARLDAPEGTVGGGFDVIDFQGASPDLSHIVFQDPNALLEGFGGGLFEWSGGQLAYVGTGELGGHSSSSSRGQIVRHAVSDNGSRVVWNIQETPEQLYLRNMEREETVSVGAGLFQTANSEGSKVFFTNNEELFVFEETEASRDGGPLAGEVTNLTGANAEVREKVIGASEDGSYVYFVAKGVLAHGGVSGEDNLYLSHGTKGDWTTTFIATLSGEDAEDWGGTLPGLGGLTARVSPNGEWLAFMSDRRLTGYDNTDVSEQEGIPGEGKKHADEEVYLFDAARPVSEDVPGVVDNPLCASCNPTGERPAGVFDPAGGEGLPQLLVDEPEVWRNRWLAGSVPGWTKENLYTAIYQSRYLSNNGRLFFDSPDALVPSDINGKEDVYEFEPEGVGGCRVGLVNVNEVFEAGAGGCVGLISAGTSVEESAFLDASGMGPGGEEAEDVFFLTAAPLVAADEDHAYDVYDAHVCSRVAPCPPSSAAVAPACTNTDSCRVAPLPQPLIFGAPPSATFNGAGNIVPSPSVPVKVTKKKTVKCKKGFVKNKKGECVKRSKSKKRAKKSSNDRRLTR
jgi:hypothetical protein